jgi:hypothetical protein
MAYNGWSNYETWNVALWLDNEQGTYNMTREVVRVSPSSVWLRALCQDTVETGFMCGHTTPRPGEYASEEVQRKAANAAGLSMTHGSVSKWDGKPERCSWYA